jgi:hypothetical protein
VTFELCSFINPDLGEPMTCSRNMNSESLKSKDNQAVDYFSKTVVAECCCLVRRFNQLTFFAHDRILGPLTLAGESSRKDTNGISVFKINFGNRRKLGGCRGIRRVFGGCRGIRRIFLLMSSRFRTPLILKQCHILALLVVPFRRNPHNISTRQCDT